ncbi:hypothetical protein INS49_006990 [Diaporthe citri]|uniref:uncharacterized protein n=1 Tax=Diaporthe citri TaxID=83186 RepID=UPI001C7F42AF|nr:uncharacterized protein INS49_006990 [Diaporthe citri]KAG6365379.1 hypothetical protein INS49_006990 [Diaporthe citri]
MTEVERTDFSALIQSKRARCRASKKRKLREVYCVATQRDALPLLDPPANDAETPTQEERRFLNDNAVLKGPFLNERNLPPRQIPPFSLPKSQGTSPRSKSQNPLDTSNHGKETGVGLAQSAPGSHAAQTRPDADESRVATTIPPAATPGGAGQPIAEPSRVDQESFAPALPPAQTTGLDLPNGASNDGSIAASNTDLAGTSTANRSGTAGREVAFVEPDKQRADSTAAQRWQNAEDVSREPASDAMDVDETPGRSDEQPRLSSLRKPPPLDASRPLDVLSSPGSTTQTATTPAVQDASPDTSPDNEGPPYPGDDDDSVRRKTDEDNRDLAGSGEAPDQNQRGEGFDVAAAQPAPAPPTEPVESTTSASGLQSSTAIVETGASNQSVATADSAPSSGHLSDSNAAAAAVTISDEAPTTRPQAGSQATPSFAQDEAHQKTRRPSPLQLAGSATSQEITGPADAVSQEPGASFSASMSTPLTNGTGFDLKTQVSQVSLADHVPDSQTEETVVHEHDQRPASSVLRARSLAEKNGHKHRRAPTVVFEKTKKKPGETIVASRSQSRPDRIPTEDYFVPLFFDGFTRQSPWMRSPEQLLVTSHKTISTPDCGIALHENQACKVLRRIYHLQQHDKWSLRQPKRCPEPTRPPSHWDLLLQEMKWMRTDFREERKWKRACARSLAEACAEWVASSQEDRKVLQVTVRSPPIDGEHSSSKTGTTPPEEESLPTPMPDLVPSGDADSPMDIDDEPRDWNAQTVAPSAIFALQDDEVVFSLQQSSTSEQLLEELPLYGAPLKLPQFDVTGPGYDPDGQWRRPALPLSKYVEGEMTLKSAGPRPRRSRYQYAVEDEDDDDEVIFGDDQGRSSDLPPENTDVALFRPEMKLVRDRLHAGHQFRPPTESLMPLQSFFESRIASQWTPAEDEELRKQVREYSYNWSLISKNISSKSLFISGEERRTPWECFERWVQLEGYPNDVARTQYFQTYQRRIDQAQRAIALANHNATQQAVPNGAVVPRRRPTLPVRVERRTPRRHLALIDAMKKLAKKREAAAAKQQQSTNNQSRRTSTEAPQQKLNIKTPEDYARARHERDKQMTEKIARTLAAQQQEAQRRAAMQGRSQTQMAQVAGAPGGSQAARTVAATHAAVAANPLLARTLGVAQQRPGMPMQQQNAIAAQMAAAGGLVPHMPVNGMAQPSQAQLAAFQQQQAVQRAALESRRIAEQQRRQQMANQAQTQGQMPPQVQGHTPQPQQQQQQQQSQQPQQQQPQQHQASRSNNRCHRSTPLHRLRRSRPSSLSKARNPTPCRMARNNYMINSMSPYTPNGMGMATSPGAVGMGMPNVGAGSPPAPNFNRQQQQLPPQIQAQIMEIENQIRAKYPNMSQQQAHGQALHIMQQRLMQNQVARNNVAQTAMDAAAGSPHQQQGMVNGMPAAASPHQYAQMLRQHQQQQQQQQVAQAQAANQANQQQHQRQPSGGATPMAGR